MNNISLTRVFCGVLTGIILSVGAAAGVVAFSLSESEVRAKELTELSQEAPDSQILEGRPLMSQASINLAMKNYGIKIPGTIKGPFYDPKLEDRGLTIRRGVTSDPIVYVGPEAFSSWPLLGSTLAHEIEIHCRQNFLAIHFQNLAGFDGTTIAEREAYRYELANAQRFGLNQYDKDLIRTTMTYFYPEQENRLAQRFVPVRAWLDRLAANGFKVRSM
jgi:hypothetical protein